MKSKMWIVGAVVFFAATATSAQPTPALTTMTPSSWLDLAGFSLGWEFTPKADIMVTDLGYYVVADQLMQAHTITIYGPIITTNGTTESSISAEVPPDPSGSNQPRYKYVDITAKNAILTQGIPYVIAAYKEVSGVDLDVAVAEHTADPDFISITPGHLSLQSPGLAKPEGPGDPYYSYLSANFQFVPVTSPVIEVDIDIKPGSFPNSVNINGNGVIPVAILGGDPEADGLDVETVDPATLTFAGLEVNVRGRDKLQVSIEDVAGPDNGPPDGYPDLVVHFADDPDLWEIGEDQDAVLNGALLNGTPIQGTDSVRVVP